MGDATYLTWHTHCGSTNHGMVVEWSTDDAITLNMKVTQYLQADLLMFTSQDAEAEYYLDPAVYTAPYKGFCDAATADVEGTLATVNDVYTCASGFQQVQALLILVNENDDCTSSMTCKDGMRALIDVKAVTDACDGTPECTAISPYGNWNLDNSVDQTVSSGYTTADDTDDDSVDKEYTVDATDDLCDEVWTVYQQVDTDADGVVDTTDSDFGHACVQYTLTMSRPFVAADPETDMTIYHDPDNTNGYATTYTFRGRFGPYAYREDAQYQCADQTIDFSTFYNDAANGARQNFVLSSLMAAFSYYSILY